MMYDGDASRPLSPITERTTPGSFRTIPLPALDTPDYTSEREGGGPDSPDGSVYSDESHGSGGTITPIINPPYDQSTLKASTTAPGPPIAPTGPIHIPIPIPPPQRAYPFPSNASPGGLLPPPRPISSRQTPPPSPGLGGANGNPSDEGRRRYNERYGIRAEEKHEAASSDGGHGENIAGLGAGRVDRSGDATVRSRPSSFHAARPSMSRRNSADLAFVDPILQMGDIPNLISPEGRSYPEFHNIPYVPDHRADQWSGSPTGSASPNKLIGRSPANSRPSSFIQRPHSFHGSRDNSRRNSYHEGLIAAKSTDSVVNNDGKDPTPPSTLRPALANRQSESSLPRTHRSPPSSARSSRRKSPPRRRTVSSIFGSLFSSDTNDAPAKKLSRRRKVSKDGGAAPHPASPTADTTSPASLEPEPITAIRTSGTFGIGDDGTVHRQGSDDTTSPSSPIPIPLLRERKSSAGAGSVQSEGAQRILYVSNVDETVFEDDEDIAVRPPAVSGTSLSPIPDDERTEESAVSREAYYTPIGMGSPTSPLSQTGFPHGGSGAATSDRPRINHRRSMSPPSARSAMFMPMNVQSKQRPLTPPPSQGVPPSPTYTEAILQRSASTDSAHPSRTASRPSTAFVPIAEKEEMIDSAMQTSPPIMGSPRRPLPRPPSISSRPPSLVVSSTSHATAPAPRSPHATPEQQPPRSPSGPRLHVPPPPPDTPSPSLNAGPPPLQAPNPARSTASSSPASDLPLLIASHLLSTHAAALMRHSTTMRDVSEIMHQMATESLEWGGILLGMSQTAKTDQPRHSAQQVVRPFQGPMYPQTGGGIDGLPSGAYQPYHRPGEGAEDPLQQAWEKLNGMGGQPFASNRSFTDSAPHPYTQQPKPQDHFTTIPPRPSASRKSSRVRLGQEEPEPSPATESFPQPSRTRPDSLPADWLGEADRLGREGWESLRKAEEAWSSAMTSLRAVAEHPRPGHSSVHANHGLNANANADRPMFAMAEEGERTIRANPQAQNRSRHTSLDLSYPRRMDRVDKIVQIERDSSFLPDMSSLSSSRRTDEPSPKDFTARPDAAHPLIRPLAGGGAVGYDNAHLGFDTTTMRSRPGSTTSYSHSTRPGQGGRKLSKKSKAHNAREKAPLPIPSAFRLAHAQEGGVVVSSGLGGLGDKVQAESIRRGGGKDGEGDGVGGQGTKRHWWSRRRAGSLAA